MLPEFVSALCWLPFEPDRNSKRNGRFSPSSIKRVPFTEEMRKDYTILCPQMSPMHFELSWRQRFNASGYHLEVLPNDNKEAVDVGLKYVNNDACYPSLMVVGQIMQALLSGKYDLHKVAIIMSQTGGGCRASNYIGFIRRALNKAGHGTYPGNLHQPERSGEQPRLQDYSRPGTQTGLRMYLR